MQRSLPLLRSLSATALLAAAIALPAAAMPQFGDAVNAFCTSNGRIPAQPFDPAAFPTNCQLCHLPGFFDKDPAHQKQPDATEYKNGNYAFFCPGGGVANTPPVLDPIGAKTATEGQRLDFVASATDADGDALVFSALNLPAGASLTDNGDGTALFRWTPAVGQAGMVTVTIVVDDAAVPPASALEDVTITVFHANRAPVFAPRANPSVDEGQPLSFSVTATDPDGDAIALSAANLPTGATFSDQGGGRGTFAWTPGFGAAGNHPVTFTAQDAATPPASASLVVTVSVGDVNRPPVLAPVGDHSAQEGEAIAFAVSASDPDGDALFLTAANLPAGATFSDQGNGSGAFAWTPAFGQAGNFAVTFTATDDGGPVASDSETVTLSVGNVNRPPVLAPVGNRTASEGQAFSLVVTATDPDGDALALQASGLPTGATFSDAGNGSGALAWTPAFGQAGNHTVTFTVMDDGSPVLADSEAVVLTVGAVNRPPVLAPIGARTAVEGTMLTIALSATDPDGDDLTLQVANAPAGANLTDQGSGSGTFTWTPGYGDAGNHAVTFLVVDDGSPMASDSETVAIRVGDVNRPPVLAPIGSQSASVSATLRLRVAASDPDGDAVALAATALPQGAVFADAGDGSGTLTWAPRSDQVGNHAVTVTASDAAVPAATASETFTVSVGAVNRPPLLVQIGSRTVNRGQTLSFALMAVDPDGDALRFDARGLPTGSTLADHGDGTAVFSWTPTAAQTGTFPVTFLVSDTRNPPASDSERLTLSTNLVPGSGFRLTRTGWSEGFGGALEGEGTGAVPGSRVEFIDGNTGVLLGVATADANGDFELGTCAMVKRKRGGRRRLVPMLECPVPFQAPCSMRARMSDALTPVVGVGGAPPQCSQSAPPRLEAQATWNVAKRKRRFLAVGGDHAPSDAMVEVRDADDHTLLGSVQADTNGRFSWTLDASAPPCRVRVGANGHYTDSIEVMQQKKGRRARWVPVCTPLVTPSPPPALPPGGGSGGGSGTAGGGSGGGVVIPPAGGGGSSGGGSGGAGGGSGGSGGSGGGGTTPAVEAFAATVYPLTRQYCVACHAGMGPGSPPFAHPDLTTAYHAVVDSQKVNLAAPDQSRLVTRLAVDGHFCWSDCAQNADTMRLAIADWASRLGGSGGPSDPAIVSAALTLADGRQGAVGLRSDDAVIARWEFKEGSGAVAHDTSGVAPALDLQLSGTQWLSGGGLAMQSGKATATPATSRKLYDLLAANGTGSQQYTVEAWIAAENTEQRGPARIITYSTDPYNRNFMLGQDNYNYVFRNRSRASGIGSNGTPPLQTADADRDLEAELQHVVLTFDQQVGRRIYVNGADTGDVDGQGPGMLTNWNPGYVFLLGNENTDDRLWKGEIRFVAVHRRALSAQEVAAHFDAGVGEKYVLRFDVSSWVGLAGAALELVAAELDGASYVFSRPTYRGPAPGAAGIRISDLRIAVNGAVPAAGQGFRNVDTVITADGQLLSGVAAIIAKDQGPDTDVFTLVLGRLGDHDAVVVDTSPPPAPGGYLNEVRPEVGIRNFDQINNTMAALTGVDPSRRNVRDTFAALTQQLPGGNDVRSFVSSHQTGIFKLALEYCDALVESGTLRSALFGSGIDFNAPVSTALGTPARKQLVADRLIDRFVGANLAHQPGPQEIGPIVTGLLDQLTAQCPNASSCSSTRTRSIVKAACSAVLSSAPVTIH